MNAAISTGITILAVALALLAAGCSNDEPDEEIAPTRGQEFLQIARDVACQAVETPSEDTFSSAVKWPWGTEYRAIAHSGLRSTVTWWESGTFITLERLEYVIWLPRDPKVTECLQRIEVLPAAADFPGAYSSLGAVLACRGRVEIYRDPAQPQGGYRATLGRWLLDWSPYDGPGSSAHIYDWQEAAQRPAPTTPEAFEDILERLSDEFYPIDEEAVTCLRERSQRNEDYSPDLEQRGPGP